MQEYWGGETGQEYWGDEDAISDLIGIRRVDSKDIVYGGKKKATKVNGRKWRDCLLFVFSS